jgi:hypothetical protein
MKIGSRTLSPAIFASALLLFAPPLLEAQEKPPLPPEVIAILGEPEGPTEGLDKAVVGALGQSLQDLHELSQIPVDMAKREGIDAL